MEWLKIENGKLVSPPTFDKMTGTSNCHLNTNWLVENGYTQWTDEQIQNFYNDDKSTSEPILITAQDYDDAMEEHLLRQREARGYTLREPSDYKDDPYERFAQDALDWIAYRSQIMVYCLQIQNDYLEGKPIPSLSEFKRNLPDIVWTIK